MDRTIPNHGSLLNDLAALDSWLASVGVPTQSCDRIHQLLKLAGDLNPREIGRAASITTEERRAYMYTLAELVEFHQIFTWLNKERTNVLRPKLIRALSGTLDPADEGVNNSDGRNTMFELSLAAEWRRAGLNVVIGEPDLQLKLDGQIFLVECKRPFDWSGMTRCMKDANRQLRRNGAGSQRGAPKGVIAISLSRVVAGGEQIFFADSMADKSKLQAIIERELAANRWRWWKSIRFDDSIAAVLFHLSLPADVGQGDHFALLSFSNVYRASSNAAGLTVLNEAIEPLYTDSPESIRRIHPAPHET